MSSEELGCGARLLVKLGMVSWEFHSSEATPTCSVRSPTRRAVSVGVRDRLRWPRIRPRAGVDEMIPVVSNENPEVVCAGSGWLVSSGELGCGLRTPVKLVGCWAGASGTLKAAFAAGKAGLRSSKERSKSSESEPQSCSVLLWVVGVGLVNVGGIAGWYAGGAFIPGVIALVEVCAGPGGGEIVAFFEEEGSESTLALAEVRRRGLLVVGRGVGFGCGRVGSGGCAGELLRHRVRGKCDVGVVRGVGVLECALDGVVDVHVGKSLHRKALLHSGRPVTLLGDIYLDFGGLRRPAAVVVGHTKVFDGCASLNKHHRGRGGWGRRYIRNRGLRSTFPDEVLDRRGGEQVRDRGPEAFLPGGTEGGIRPAQRVWRRFAHLRADPLALLFGGFLERESRVEPVSPVVGHRVRTKVHTFSRALSMLMRMPLQMIVTKTGMVTTTAAPKRVRQKKYTCLLRYSSVERVLLDILNDGAKNASRWGRARLRCSGARIAKPSPRNASVDASKVRRMSKLDQEGSAVSVEITKDITRTQ